MTRRVMLAGCLLLMTMTAAAGGRQDQAAADRPRFGTSTAAVVVDVIVRDKKGNPVVDLAREDFQVFENGTPQTVIDFEGVLPGQPGTPEEASGASPAMQGKDAPADAPRAPTLQGQAVTAIVFDWLGEQSRYEAWKAASTLLGQMEPSDYAAVFIIDQALRRVVPYTRDTSALRQAFDFAVNRPRPGASRTQSALIDSMVTQRDTPLTPGAEAGAPGLVNTRPVAGPGAAAALAAMLDRMVKWEAYMNRQQQGHAVSTALLGLVEQLSGMPGRKTVVLFSEGLEIPDGAKHRFDAMEARANRHNVSFYTIDAAGLRVHSRMPMIAAAIGEAGEENASRGIADDGIARRTEAMWRDPTAGLRPLAERTGGLYIGDTNDLAGGFAKVNADRRFHYLLGYSSSNPALDGTYRKIDVRVRRPGVRIRARGGYVAAPSIERTDRRDYETPAIAALAASPAPAAFPFQPRAISTPMRGEPGMTALIAAVDAGVVTFREDAAQKTYDGELTVLARIVSTSGDPLATQSQLYRMHGDLKNLAETKRGRLLFFRTPSAPPGGHTVEWVVRDGASGRASVLRSRVDVPLPDLRPVVGDLVIVDHAEKAPKDEPALDRHPLAWKGLLLYPSLGLPISKAARTDLTFFLPMLVDEGEPVPATTMELLRSGRSLATIPLPAGHPEQGSFRQVGTLPIDKLPPGVYELKASIRAGDRVVTRTAAFTLVP